MWHNQCRSAVTPAFLQVVKTLPGALRDWPPPASCRNGGNRRWGPGRQGRPRYQGSVGDPTRGRGARWVLVGCTGHGAHLEVSSWTLEEPNWPRVGNNGMVMVIVNSCGTLLIIM